MVPRLPLLSAAVLLGLAACNDPADRYQPPSAGGSAPPPAPTEGGPASPGPTPDGAGPPPGGGDGDPAGGGCTASQVSLENLPVPEGKGVTISGTISGPGTGPALIEVIRLEGSRRVGIYNFVCPGVGSFELLSPPDLGDLYLVTFIDEGGDGPTDDDVAGYVGPVTVGSTDISGLAITVQADADLGKVSLPHEAAWGPPPPADGEEASPADGSEPPGEGTPPEGPPPEGPPPEGPPPEGPPPEDADPADAPPVEAPPSADGAQPG